MRLLWQQYTQEKDWWFILIDARNVFKKENRTAILWVVRFEWPSGARFAFRCYRHWAMLLIRSGYGTDHFLFSKERLTQVEPLAMVVYMQVVLPLIRELQKTRQLSPSTWMKMGWMNWW